MEQHPLKLSTDRLSPLGYLRGLAPPIAYPWTAARTATVHVLLAHRHGIFSQGLAALLAACPEVELLAEVADGDAAWEIIKSDLPEVALLDLDLPDVSGIELARRVHEAALATRCLILATAEDPPLPSGALYAGVAGCLRKDGGFEEVLRALHGLDRGAIDPSPSLAPWRPTPPGEASGPEPLTPRELQIVRLVAAGQSSKTIARVLDISPQTVGTHRRRLMKKLGLHCAAAVGRYAAEHGLLA